MSDTPSKRAFEVFGDIDEPAQPELPQSVSGKASENTESEADGSDKKALPLRLKVFLGGVVLALGCIAWVELARVYRYFSEIHTVVGIIWLVLLVGLGIFGVTWWWRSMRELNALSQAELFREEAESHLIGNNFGNTGAFQKQLQKFYQGKPQMPHLAEALKTLPDVANDNEVIKHLERTFVAKLDALAQEKVNHYATRNGLMIALSPWPLIDSVLCFANCFRMAKAVALAYGLQPSYTVRWQLIKRIASNVVIAAGTETVISTLMEDSSLASLTTVSVRVGQGLGVGLYTARIGCYAMAACRPFPFDQCPQPKTRDLIRSLVNKLKG